MKILVTYAFNSANPGTSVVRHIQTDTPIASISGPNGPVPVQLDRTDGSAYYDYLVAGFIPLPKPNSKGLPDGVYTITGTDGSTATLVVFFGNLNGDATVDAADEAIFNAAYPSSRGQANYNDQCDWQGIGSVTLDAYSSFSGNFGQTVPAA